MRPGWWGSIPSSAWSITWNGRPSDHALRLLAPGVRRLAAERSRRGDGGELGVRAPAGPAQRGPRLRPHPGRRAELERHQGAGRALARCLEHGGGAGGRDRAARARGGRLSLNVVSSWWSGEARQYGVAFDQHDARYARTAEWLEVVTGMWSQPHFSYAGQYYRVENATLEPKPLARPRPTLYAGGESEAAKDLIARACDAYLMHGDPPERVAAKVADMRARRERLAGSLAPLTFGLAAYVVCAHSETAVRREVARITDVRQSAAGYANYQDWLANTQLEQQVSLEDYSVSNRGLRAGL